MIKKCTNDSKTCTGRKAHYRALWGMVGSGIFLFISVNALLRLLDLHFRQGQAWSRDGMIDGAMEGAMAVFALLVLLDAVRSFREGVSRRLAFFGGLMSWSIVFTFVLILLLVQFAHYFA
jgi:uncharacterized membrane protein (GlpM family)